MLARGMPDVSERSVVYISRRLAQVDREALAVVRKVHLYLYGCQFTTITDHKSLLSLLDANKATPSIYSSWILR